jgi:hypothetical protein
MPSAVEIRNPGRDGALVDFSTLIETDVRLAKLSLSGNTLSKALALPSVETTLARLTCLSRMPTCGNV